MSKSKPEGYFEYVVAPLEGLWDLAGGAPDGEGIVKKDLIWTSMIRQPEFVDAAVFEQACAEAAAKKKRSTAAARGLKYLKRACACSACTSAPTTKRRRRSKRSNAISKRTDLQTTYRTRADIMKFI
jgi:hypothetical protein